MPPFSQPGTQLNSLPAHQVRVNTVQPQTLCVNHVVPVGTGGGGGKWQSSNSVLMEDD